MQQGNLKLKEYNSDPYFIYLKNNLRTEYLFLSFYYNWYFRRFYLEAGAGLGVNQSYWNVNGFSITKFGLSKEEGFFSGSGLSYRLETSLNRKLLDSIILQLGIGIDFHTVPSFRGTLNEDPGSIYIRSDGSLSQMTENETLSNLNLYNSQVLREIDMASSNILVFFSVIHKIQF
ncbi:MAG: hypothetical protein H7A25_02355 [Leptospiraceae bacterium]|nr:hypothetical protein [Leptospiraceae bacterium]MCP5498719.1 hypothetical protein [Leptospiraceae bacterium]